MSAPNRYETLVAVIGGSGFLGRHIVRALARRDFRIRVGVRRPDLSGHLQPLGRVGQIHAVQANVRYPSSIEPVVRDAGVVINLTGVLFERGRQSFEAIHTAGSETVARAAAREGAQLIHFSAIGADGESPSSYAQSKAQGEAAVRAAARDALVVRPSVVFGPEDDFLNRFAALARMSPALPLFGGGHTRFQPVWVTDVAEAVAAMVEGNARPGATYELGGPDVCTFRQIMELVLKTTERRRLLLPIPFAIGEFAAFFLQFLPKPPLTPDQVRLLRADNVVSEAASADGRTLQGLGITPTAMEAVAPSYLWRFRKAGQFSRRAA